MSNIALSFDVNECQRVELSDPERLELRHQLAHETVWIATFTANCRTVAMLGPPRTFWEQSAAHAVTHGVWVRTLPEPFDGAIDDHWLVLALEANDQGADDVLAISMQYLKGAPPIRDGGMKVGGDVGYGPLLMSGEREEGADFNDYLGITWHYQIPPRAGQKHACPKPDKCRESAAPAGERWCLDAPESRQLGCLDCSGYMRMTWGFRHHLPYAAYPSGVPLGLCLDRCGKTLPRQARDMAEGAPGVFVIPNDGERPTAATLETLQVGDLVFFDRDKKDGTTIDHVGMYLGEDQGGNLRFISSRKTANGPTLGDCGGKSVLNGSGDFAKALRAARRL